MKNWLQPSPSTNDFFVKETNENLICHIQTMCMKSQNKNGPPEIISTQVLGTTNYNFAQKKCIDQFSWKLSSWHTMFYSYNSHPESTLPADMFGGSDFWL